MNDVATAGHSDATQGAAIQDAATAGAATLPRTPPQIQGPFYPFMQKPPNPAEGKDPGAIDVTFGIVLSKG